MEVKCRKCGKLCEYSDKNPFRPFCSRRCRVLDLGAWADENYKIAENESGDQDSVDEIDENES